MMIAHFKKINSNNKSDTYIKFKLFLLILPIIFLTSFFSYALAPSSSYLSSTENKLKKIFNLFEEEQTKNKRHLILPDNNLLSLALDQFYSYNLANVLLIFNQLSEDPICKNQIKDLLKRFSLNEYSNENGWNESNKDIEEQTALFRGIETTFNSIYDWNKYKKLVPTSFSENSLPLFFQGDVHYNKKKILLLNGITKIEKTLKILFQDNPDPQNLLKKYEQLQKYILESNIRDDLSRQPMELSVEEKYIINDIDKLMNMLRKADVQYISMLTDNLGSETYHMLLETFLLLQLGKTITIYSKQEPCLFGDSTLSDLQYSILIFDEIIQKHFKTPIKLLKNYMLEKKLFLSELPFKYLPDDLNDDGKWIPFTDYNFLEKFDIVIFQGELLYGNFMRDQIRKRGIDLKRTQKLSFKSINPFMKTSIVLRKSNKNTREILIVDSLIIEPEQQTTKGEFVLQVLEPNNEYLVDSIWDYLSTDINKIRSNIKDTKNSFLFQVEFSIKRVLNSLKVKIQNNTLNPNLALLTKFNDLQTFPEYKLDGKTDGEIGWFALTANPFTFGHLLTALLTQDILNLDTVIYKVQGEIGNKKLRKADNISSLIRFLISRSIIKNLFPIARITDLNTEPDNPKEGFETLLDFINLNKGFNHKYNYIIGIEDLKRVEHYTKLFYATLYKYKDRNIPIEKITIVWVKRKDYGGYITIDTLNQLNVKYSIQYGFTSSLNVKLVKDYALDLGKSSTNYRLEHDATVVPSKVDIWAKKMEYYGHSDTKEPKDSIKDMALNFIYNFFGNSNDVNSSELISEIIKFVILQNSINSNFIVNRKNLLDLVNQFHKLGIADFRNKDFVSYILNNIHENTSIKIDNSNNFRLNEDRIIELIKMISISISNKSFEILIYSMILDLFLSSKDDKISNFEKESTVLKYTLAIIKAENYSLSDYLYDIAGIIRGKSYYLDGLLMAQTFELSRQGREPIGAVAHNTKTGKLIYGEKFFWHIPNSNIEFSQHAELNAMQKAIDAGWDMNDVSLYISVESCFNCAMTLSNFFRPKRIMYGCIDGYPNIRGKGNAILNALNIDVQITPIKFLQKEAEDIMDNFYRTLSDNEQSLIQKYWDERFKPYPWNFKDLYANDTNIYENINKILNGDIEFTFDTRKELTLLVYFLIKKNKLLPLEEFPQIIAIDANHMSMTNKNKWSQTLIDIGSIDGRINKKNDRLKVILLGSDENIQKRYNEIIDNFTINPKRIYVLKDKNIYPYTEYLRNLIQLNNKLLIKSS